MSDITAKGLRSEQLSTTEGEQPIPLSIQLIRLEAAAANGDIFVLMKKIGCDEQEFAKIVIGIAMNDAKGADESRLDDKALVKKYQLGSDMILFGIRNNPEYENVFVAVTKAKSVKSKYADILDGVVKSAIQTGNAQSAKFALTHAGLHKEEDKNNNTQINIYNDSWKRQIGDIIDSTPQS